MSGVVDVAAVAALAATALGVEVRGARLLAERAGATVVVAVDTDRLGTVVAKAPAGPSGCDGAVAAAAARALATTEAADRGPDGGPLAVPRLLAVDVRTGLQVTEQAPGRPLDGLLRSRPDAALRGVGRALARLHALPVVVGPPAGVAEHLADLVRPHPAVLAAGLPGLAAQVHAVLDGVLAAEPAQAPRRPLHRDVHARQLHVDGERTWLLDWDLAAQGDPAFDLGNLSVSLRTKLSDREGEAAVRALRDGYAAGDTTGALARTAPYEAFTCLRLACKRFRLQGAAAAAEVAGLLDAAEQHLAGERARVPA